MPAAFMSFDVSRSPALTLPISLTVELKQCRSLLKPAILRLLKEDRAGAPLERLPRQLPDNRQTPDE
jgi:hypothetical protein